MRTSNVGSIKPELFQAPSDQPTQGGSREYQQELDKLSTAAGRLGEAWQKYQSSQQDVLGLVAEDNVADEQVIFTKMKETYKAAIGEASKIIKGEFWAKDKEGDPRSEQAIQLAAQRRSIQGQALEILDCVKERLEKVEITTSRGSLKT